MSDIEGVDLVTGDTPSDLPKEDLEQGAAMSSLPEGSGGAGGAAASLAPDSILNFQTDLFTGRFTYSVPIAVPPGRGNSQPSVVLGYNSSAGNGWCGVGWTLDMGYIQREIRYGVPRKWGATSPLNEYDDAYGFVFSLGGVNSRLVNVGGSVYRAETDNGSFLKFEYNNPSWTVTDKNGNKFYFGESAASRMENPNWTPNLGKSTFRWAIGRVRDVNGNETAFTYAKDSNQLYLDKISYNANVNLPSISATHDVNFILEDRADKVISYAPGYRVEQRKRLKKIQTKVSGNNARKYVLGYTSSPCTFRSLLSSVTQYGSDYSSALPPLTFTYQVQPLQFGNLKDWMPLENLGYSTSNGWNSVRAAGNGGADDKDTYVEFTDMDNDGFPDRVLRNLQLSPPPYYLDFQVQPNTGTNFSEYTSTWQPVEAPTYWPDWELSSIKAVGVGGTIVELTDLNGDGLPDRFWQTNSLAGYDRWHVQTNTAFGVFSSHVSWVTITSEYGSGSREWCAIRSGSPEVFVDLIDVNGDGWPDRVMRKLNSPYNAFKVQLNTGSGFGSLVNWGTVSSQGQTDYKWNSISATATDGNAYVSLFDINGDGLPDRVMRKYAAPYTSFVVQFNNGAGFEAEEYWGPLGSQGQTNTIWNSPFAATNSITHATMIDLNADGLPDRVMRRLSSPYDRFIVELNTGSGFTNAIEWAGVTSEAGTSASDWNSPVASKYRATYVDLVDINGDGLPDRVMRELNPPYDRLKVQQNTGPFPDLLATIENSLGGKVEVNYRAATKWDNRDLATGLSLLPHPLRTVSSVIVFDGFGSADTNTYSFAGGMYDFVRREFSGFNRVTVTDPLGAQTTTFFHQGGGTNDTVNGEYQDAGSIAKRGIPYRTETWGSDGLKYSQTINKVEQAQLHANGWFFPFISQTIGMEYEGLGNYRATAKQFFYNTSTGNLTNETSLGEVTSVNVASHTFTDIGSDSVYSHITYATLTNPDIQNKPASVKISSDSGGTVKLRETLFNYDPNRGNLTRQLAWLNTASSYVTNSIVYDQYGNVTSTTNAVGIGSRTIYDATYQLFPITQITATFTNQATFNVLSGQTITAIDAKGLVSSNAFDVFFRPTQTSISTNAFGAATLWREKLDYNLGGLTNGVSSNYVRRRVFDAVDLTNGHETYSYADGLGRTVQVRVESETASQYRVVDTFSDERGNPEFVTLPYFSSGTAFTTGGASQLGELTAYDAIGRVVSNVSPAYATGVPAGDTGSPVGWAQVAYKDGTNPWGSVATDPEGKVHKAYQDAYGRTVQIVEVTGGGSYNTYYQHDKVGNLTNVTDNANNKTWMNYDSLGRKTSMTEPNMGTWSYAYDAGGRMTQQTDAKNQKLKFYYNDSLGRLTSKEIYNSSDVLQATVNYTYDTSDDPAYSVFKGQLYKVTDREGWQKNSYDVRGRALKSGRYLNVNGQTYVVQSSYDDADRVNDVTYPGNVTKIRYSYDTGGNLNQVASLCGTGSNEVFYAVQGFNALGQLSGITYGNGLQTTNSYFTYSGRLKRIQTTKPGGGYHQDLTYTFDKVSNVKSITDAIYSGSASSTLTSATYDDLHRLTAYTRNSVNYTFTYNAIGNMTMNGEFGAGSYTYGSSKPHAVTSANGKSYSYDACGNMTNRNGQVLIYDEENQLKGAGSVSFGYADGGVRLWKSNAGQLTIWIGGIYEIKGGKTLCHVLAGGRRIATFEPINPACAWLQNTHGVRCVYAFAQATTKWPLQNGRTPLTVMLIPLVGILGGSLWGRRRSGGGGSGIPGALARRYSRQWFDYLGRDPIASSPARRFAVSLISVVLIVALFFVTTETRVEAATYDPVFYYYHPDHLGSSNILTDRSGNLVDHYENTAFGKERYNEVTPAFSISHRYTGQVFDEDTGLYYYNSRYYDPELGRFIQADTIVPDPDEPQALNRYTYVLNNPLKYVDPSGHWFLLALLGAFVGGMFSGVMSVLQGGSFGRGFLAGAVAGFLVGAGIGIGGAWSSSTPHLGSTVGGAIGGAAGGAASAAIQGGNVGLGALIGGASGALFGYLDPPTPDATFYSPRALAEGLQFRINPAVRDIAQASGGLSPAAATAAAAATTSIVNSIGAPGVLESMIPVWGSARAAINDFQTGHWAWGTFNTVMAISDVFLVKSMATGLAKGAINLGAKSFKWGATSARLHRAGYAVAREPIHHWAIPKRGWGTHIPEWIKNQGPNLMPVESQVWHQALHGTGPQALPMAGRLWYGTPEWVKATTVSYGGRGTEIYVREGMGE